MPLGTPRLVNVKFANVTDTVQLQGADIVATESYWHALALLRTGDQARPRPHLQHFIDNMLCEALILNRDGIQETLRHLDQDASPGD